MTSRAPRLLVGVDGTEGSVEALRWAAHEAARRSWPLHVITCAELPVAVEAGMIGSGAITGTAMEGIVSEHEAVNQRAVNLARSFGLPIEVTGETVLGAPAYALVGAAHGDDIIVIGATSHPGRLSDVLGSVASVVAHRAHGAVVVVHGSDRRDAAIGRVAVGVDGSPGSDAALLWAADEAVRCMAELVLVHGWTYPYQGPRTGVSEPRDDMRLDAMRTLEASTLKVKEAAPSLRCHSIISEQSPAKAIIDAGKDADLVVVGSRGHGGFASLLLGSVSRTVLQHSVVPVAVIRHPD
ncbi:MAG: universal stress protein [Actinobacteria bacterium]|nr:universal stress protein [Actinomycetota bacterium]